MTRIIAKTEGKTSADRFARGADMLEVRLLENTDNNDIAAMLKDAGDIYSVHTILIYARIRGQFSKTNAYTL